MIGRDFSQRAPIEMIEVGVRYKNEIDLGPGKGRVHWDLGTVTADKNGQLILYGRMAVVEEGPWKHK